MLRFEKETSGIEAGTVVFENGEIVFGYPKIRRPLMLAAAINRHFSDLVAVEEKMNGHNVRILSINGETVALTRGGFICPYSTEVAAGSCRRRYLKSTLTWSCAERWWARKIPM